MISEEITKGPWVINPDRHPLNACVEVIDEKSGRHIAVLYGVKEAERGEDGVWCDQPIRDAKARLVAAAPDLLAALKMILDVYKSHVASTSDIDTLEDNPFWRIALAAIAKAEGGAS